MLLILDESLINGIGSNSNVIEALELIAQARRLGKHIVFGNRKILSFLANCELLSRRASEVYRKLYETFPTSRVYVDKIGLSVEIVLDDTLELITRGSSRIIRASINYFKDFTILDHTVLLLEDLDDASFYKRLAKAYLVWQEIGNVFVMYDPRNGGGQNTHKTFSTIQNRKDKFCLCLLDSDRRAPNLDIGDTAKAVCRVNDKTQPLCDALILGVREIENLIPTSLYRATFESDSNKSKTIDFLERLEESQFAENRKYLDIKKGLTLAKVLKEEPQKVFRKHWIYFATNFNADISQQCLSSEACSTPSSCNCYVTLGFGDDIIKKLRFNI
jgi:hypothetical protein